MEKISDKDEKNDNISSESKEIISTKQKNDDNEHEDLEDGEIETDDDNDNDDEPIIISSNDTNSNIKISSIKRTTDSDSVTSQIIDKNEHQNEITSSSLPIKLIGSSTESCKSNSNKIDLTTTSNDKLTINSSSHTSNKSISDVPTNKKSKHRFVDDDWAGNVENAIAAALKKEGVILPKARERVEADSADSDEGIGGGGGDVTDVIGRIKNKAGKKRKKRESDRKSKKKMKHHDDTNDDIDDYEMLCIRGGSPPPITSSQMHHHSHSHHSHHPPKYYDSDNSYSSYDSFDSQEYKSVSHQERRQMRKMKDRRRKIIDREDRSGNVKRGGNNEKRKRNDDRDYDGICIPNMRGFCPEGDDCPRSHDARAQRKLELCKFYLMECCAKKDKCSYMHSDFPCKFYYLGMECIYKGACKFSHGKPLTEQLRQILLKHIETAPKEILGNFRRISREHAVTLMNATHARLCAEQGIENTLASQTSTTTSLTTVTSNMMMPMMKQSQHEQLLQQQQILTTGSSGATSSIPSLLDIVIKPPIPSPRKDDKSLSNLMTTAKGEKQRKSRWCDTNDINSLHGNGSGSISIGSGSPGGASDKGLSAPDVLSLRNLTGVITLEQIEKLAAMGIENLEQVNQLTVAQLNNLGLTIQQISEIQLNALNIEKLGLIKSPIHSMSSPSTTSTTCSYLGNLPPSIVSTAKTATSPISSNRKTTTGTGNTIDFVNPTGLYSDPTATNPTQDIDMRFLIGTNTSENDHHRSASPIKTSFISSGIASPDAIQPAKSCLDYGIDTIMKNDTLTTIATASTNLIDYSQYLKDSNLDVEKTDLNDISLDRDDGFNEDEPELQIDESWMDPNDEEKNSNVKNDDQNSDNELKNENDSITTIPKVSSPDIWKPLNFSSNNRNLGFIISKSPTYYQENSNSEDEEDNWDTDDDKKKKKSNDDDYNKKEKSYTSNLLGLGIGNNETREFRGDPRLQKNIIQKSFGDYVPIISSSYTTNINDLSYNNSNNDNNILNDNWSTSFKTNSTTDVTELSTGTTKYQRISIYDGNPSDMDREDDSTSARKKHDKDMRMSSFIDSTNSDIDLRLPFKPVMTNYTPATEIDGSISSHSPIPYKVYEIDIPKPSYNEIRRSIPVTDKTLDPRLRRIFCLKDSVMNNDLEENVINQTSDIQFSSICRSGSIGNSNNNGQKRNEDQNDKVTSNTATNISITSSVGHRADPRRRKESQDNILGGGSTGSGNSGDKNQGVDIRLILQKSNWYKNLNSKYKIMVNQQLALVSTELKKFHQDTKPNKVFDMSFLGINQNLQQILSNLCIYIDEKGHLKELEGDNDGDEQSSSMSGMMGMGGMSGMDPNVANNVQQMVGAGGGLVMPGGVNGPGQMNAGMLSVMPGAAAAMYMRGGPPLNMGSGGSGGPIIPQFRPQRYDNIRPGLLGIAPGIQFNPFDPTSGTGNNMTDSGDSSGGYGNNSGGDDQNNFNAFLGCGSGSGNLFDQGNFFGRAGGNESGNRGMRNNYRQGGSGGGGGRIQNDRWNTGSGVGGSGNRDSGNLRRNFDGKNRDGEGRRGNKKLKYY